MRRKVQKSLAMAVLTAACLLPHGQSEAKKLNIIYIPLDNRPVCSAYVAHTLKAADCNIIMPPEKYIANHLTNGNPDKIWEWLQHKAPKADAAVISTDSLIYGGLVASRTHHYTQEQLNARIHNLYDLKSALPIKLYAFSTIMRTPRASKGRVEPSYYSTVGPSIFAYSQLLDESDQNKLTPAKQLTMQALERNLRKDNLRDWLERREKNFSVNQELTRLARNGRFHYFAIGKDDNAVLSATHMEARRLTQVTFDMQPTDFQILDGVDQLGLLLVTRAYNEAHNITPEVYTMHTSGVGLDTLPQYSDALLRDSIPKQIIAAGAVRTDSPERAKLILAVNTPQDGIVKDSTADDNQFFATPANKAFTEQIAQQLNQQRNVSLADISYSNGADNGFMDYFANHADLSKLAAYNGWNTADNAIGYAIAQGLLAPSMKYAERQKLIKQRLLDDWFYQSNARRSISGKMEAMNREDMKYDLGTAEKFVLQESDSIMRSLAQKYTYTKGVQYSLSYPWARLFEIDVKTR